jgi:hypothetical protein
VLNLDERILSLRERMAEGQVREMFETSLSFPHPSAAESAALCPLPEGEGLKRGMYGLRFHGGVYGVVNGGDLFVGPRVGAIVGYEEAIQSKISMVADWFSGKNFFGYFTPGGSLALPKNSVFNAGYSIGNDSYHGNDNRFVFLYYGITF